MIMNVVTQKISDISKLALEEKKEDNGGRSDGGDDAIGSSQHAETNTKLPLLSHFPELRINSAGHGPISAEFLLPKSMWIK